MSLSVVLLLSSHLAVPEICWYLEWNAMLLLGGVTKKWRWLERYASGHKTVAPWQPEIVCAMTLRSLLLAAAAAAAAAEGRHSEAVCWQLERRVLGVLDLVRWKDVAENYYYYYYYHHHHHHRISHFSSLAGKYSPILGFSNHRIRLGGLSYGLESFLQLNMCQGLQIFAFV